MTARLRVLVSSLLATTLACNPADSDETGTEAVPTSSVTGTADATGTTDMIDSSGTAGPSTTGPLSLEACMEQTGIDLDCSDESRIQFVTFGDVLGCGGFSSFNADEELLFVFDDIVDGDLQISALRLIDNPVSADVHFEAVPQASIPMSRLPTDIMGWTGEVHSLPVGIFDIVGGSVNLTLDNVPPAAELDVGAVVSGTFEVMGGTVTNIGDEVDDPGIQAFGCFVAPAGAEPA